MLKQLPTKYESVYILEADEWMTPDLFNECLQAIQTSEYIGYYVAKHNFRDGNLIFLPSAHKIVTRATKIKVGFLKTCNNSLQVLKRVTMERCFQPEEMPNNPYG